MVQVTPGVRPLNVQLAAVPWLVTGTAPGVFGVQVQLWSDSAILACPTKISASGRVFPVFEITISSSELTISVAQITNSVNEITNSVPDLTN
jgi:hypothetical protein